MKSGIFHDYDLMANAEPAAQKKVVCAVCDQDRPTYQWSDYSGEGMCTRCGCAYQLKWGSDKQKAEGAYPYLNLRDDFLPIAREFWKQKHTFVHYGMSFTRRDGMAELDEFIGANYPDFGKGE